MTTPETLTERILATPWVRRASKVFLDGGAAAASWNLASLTMEQMPDMLQTSMLWTALALSVHLLFRLSRQHYRVVVMNDLLRVAGACGVLLLAGWGIHHVWGWRSEGSPVYLLATMFTFLHWMGIRIAIRVVGDRSPAEQQGPRTRTLIVGAGRAGSIALDEIRRHPEMHLQVVGFIDDAFSKQGLLVDGIPVLGPQELLSALIAEHDIKQIVLAIPSASGDLARHVSSVGQALGVRVKTLPGISTLLGERDWKPEIRDVSIEDLLRRDPIRLDQEALRDSIQGETVLITGGGGSIGSELARQVARFEPGCIVLLGRGENSLWLAERQLRDCFPDLELAVVLCDVRNRLRLEEAFQRWKPAIVFHAAAHKHVPVLEHHPEEAIENNVFGTWHVVEACLGSGVRHLVNISTDKAVNPTSVLGVSKRIAEFIVADASRRATGAQRHISVRFGNVLGSRGSVVPVFTEQIRRGGPVTVTHPEMTRYFMTIPEASQLVIQAGLMGEGGHVYVLDMGTPVRITDLAKDLISLSGFVPHHDIKLRFSGIRPGEKLFEEIFHDPSNVRSDLHEKVLCAAVEMPDPLELRWHLERLREALTLPEQVRHRQLLVLFQQLVPSFKPATNGFVQQCGLREEAESLPPRVATHTSVRVLAPDVPAPIGSSLRLAHASGDPHAVPGTVQEHGRSALLDASTPIPTTESM